MAWTRELMIKAIEGALEREKAVPNNSGIIGISFQIAEGVLLPMLKEKQPNEPMQLKYSETREEYWFYESICPKCGNRWISNGTDHFCPACGQPVFEPCEEEQKDGEQE